MDDYFRTIRVDERASPAWDQRTRYDRVWNWARDGGSSCSIIELRYDRTLYLHVSLRAPPASPPKPGSYEEDATARIAFEMLSTLVDGYLKRDCTLISMSERAAVVQLSYEAYAEKAIETRSQQLASEAYAAPPEKRVSENLYIDQQADEWLAQARQEFNEA